MCVHCCPDAIGTCLCSCCIFRGFVHVFRGYHLSRGVVEGHDLPEQPELNGCAMEQATVLAWLIIAGIYKSSKERSEGQRSGQRSGGWMFSTEGACYVLENARFKEDVLNGRSISQRSGLCSGGCKSVVPRSGTTGSADHEDAAGRAAHKEFRRTAFRNSE